MALGKEKLERRRLTIIGAVRRLIAERGYDGVTMRDLAREADVTVATLYNQFGSKNQLMIAAVEEIFRNEVDPAIGADRIRGLERVLAGAQRAANIAEIDPDFPRALAVELAHDTPAGNEMGTAFGKMHHDQVRLGLDEMAEDGELAEWLDRELLTDVILLEGAAATREWATRGRSGAWLRHRCALGAAMILWGASTGPARGELDLLVESLHESAAEGS